MGNIASYEMLKESNTEIARLKAQNRIYNINLGKKNTLLWYMNVGWTCIVFRMQLAQRTQDNDLASSENVVSISIKPWEKV